jgi:low affinity Fe/Cu permease
VLAGWGLVGIAAGFPHWWEVALYSSTSAVTVVMLFAVQHTQHRQQLVTQRKLDELLRAQPEASNSMIAAESVADEELDALVAANSAAVATSTARAGRWPTSKQTVDSSVMPAPATRTGPPPGAQIDPDDPDGRRVRSTP